MTKLIDEPTPATLKTTHILSHIMFNISHISLFIFYSCAIVSKNVGMWIISWTILWTKKSAHRLYCGVKKSWLIDDGTTLSDGCTTPTLQDQKLQTKRACCRERGALLTVGRAVTEKQFQAQDVEDLKFWIFIWYHHRRNHFGWFSFALQFGFKPPTHVWTRKNKSRNGLSLMIENWPVGNIVSTDKIRLEKRPSNTLRHNFGILLTSKVSNGSFSPPYSKGCSHLPLMCVFFSDSQMNLLTKNMYGPWI